MKAKLNTFQETIKDLKEQILVASKKLKECADAAVSAENVVPDLQAELAKSEKRCRKWYSELINAQK